MKRVLITGANGFIGRKLVNCLLEKGIDVTAVVRNAENLTNIKNDYFHVVYCTLEEIDKLEGILEKEYYDIVFHLAWSGTCGIERSDYVLQSNNIRATLDVVHTAAKLGIKRFVGAGTIAEYDNLCYLPNDGAVPDSIAMYGSAKIAAHFMSKIECNKLGMEHVWGIFSNIYGPDSEVNNFVKYAADTMLAGERAAFTAGEQYYDFVYISDFINGLYLMGEYGKANHEYFIGSGAPRKLKEYIYAIKDAIDENIELYMGEIPFHGISLKPEQLSIKKLQNDTGYVPLVDFEWGIQKTVEFLRHNI